MAGRTVTTPAGERWRVGRVWAPRLGGETLWARLRRRTRIGRSLARGAGEAGDPGCLLDAASDAFWVLVIVIVVTVLVLVGVPLVLALVDIVVLAVLTLLGIAARVLFRRPWVVDARSTAAPPAATDAGPSDAPVLAVRRHTWRVVGWRASGEQVEHVANALAHGNPLPAGATADAVRPDARHLDGPDAARPA